jgi:hypothetical protein
MESVMEFELDDLVITPSGKAGKIIGETIENNIHRYVILYDFDGQIVELQPKLLREV